MLNPQFFVLHRTTRQTLLKYLDTLSVEQLAYIPPCFKNNIYWNIAHCVAQQQLLCYKLSGNAPVVSEHFVQEFKKDTFPSGKIPTLEEVNLLKELLIFSQKQLEQDYYNHLFDHFSPYQTSYGFELHSIDDAIHFNNTHEGMHLGAIKTLLYFV